jgi:hypothetical protein
VLIEWQYYAIVTAYSLGKTITASFAGIRFSTIFSLRYCKIRCIVRASDFQVVLLLFGSVPAETSFCGISPFITPPS